MDGETTSKDRVDTKQNSFYAPGLTVECAGIPKSGQTERDYQPVCVGIHRFKSGSRHSKPTIRVSE